MSEAKKEARELQTIQNEYQNLCVRAGHLQYQLYAITKDLELVNQNLRDLNLEAASAQAKAVEVKKEDEKAAVVA